MTVKDLEPNRRILIAWGNYDFPTTVDWVFTPYGDDSTYVSITNSDFKGDGDKVIDDVLDSKGGFSWVPAG